MRNLIINADDFGLSREVNQGVEEAIESGLLNNVSLMVNLPFFDGAVTFLKQHPEVSVGLHFNVTEGKPILPPSEVGSLLKEDDSFYFWLALIARILVRDAKIADVEKEFLAQFAKLTATGLTISHIDSHHHLHLYPPLFKFFNQFAAEKKIRFFRSQNNSLWSLTAGIGKRPTLKQLIINAGFLVNNFLTREKQTETVEGTYDLNWERDLSEEELIKILDHLPQGKTELICHLGVLSPNGNTKFLEPRFRVLKLLGNERVKRRILYNGIELLKKSL